MRRQDKYAGSVRDIKGETSYEEEKCEDLIDADDHGGAGGAVDFLCS